MRPRVIQWGTGNTGAFALRYLTTNPAYELVGVLCHSEAKVGRDAGELAGGSPIGVRATNDKQQMFELAADIVVYMPRTMHQDPSVPDSPDHAWYLEMCALLRSGKNVVTPITAGGHHRHLARGQQFRDALDAAGRAGNSTVSFLGLDPGFFTDALPLSIAAAVGEVRQIRTYEVLSYAYYPNIGTLGRLGLGGDPDTIGRNIEAMIRPTWGGVPYVLADAVGVELDGIEIDIDIELAPDTFTSPGGMAIERGTVGGMNFRVSGLVDGAPRFILNHVTRMRDDIGAQWPVVGDRGGYRIEIDAFPPVTLDFPLGLPGGTGNAFDDALAMTAARSVNAIDSVIAAAPGYRSFRELAPLTAQHTVY